MNHEKDFDRENTIHIDVNSIPKYKREALAAATFDLIRGILSQPGGREALDKEIAKLGLR